MGAPFSPSLQEPCYYDLSGVEVTKKQPLTIDRFEGFFELMASRGDSEQSWTMTREEVEARRFDLKAVNPNTKSEVDSRTPQEARNCAGRRRPGPRGT